MSTDEKLTAFAFAITVGLWIFGGSVGVNAVAAALTGLGILLVTGGCCVAGTLVLKSWGKGIVACAAMTAALQLKHCFSLGFGARWPSASRCGQLEAVPQRQPGVGHADLVCCAHRHGRLP